MDHHRSQARLTVRHLFYKIFVRCCMMTRTWPPAWLYTISVDSWHHWTSFGIAGRWMSRCPLVDSGPQLVKRVVQPDVGDGEFVKCQLLGHQLAWSFSQFFALFASFQQLEVHWLLIEMEWEIRIWEDGKRVTRMISLKLEWCFHRTIQQKSCVFGMTRHVVQWSFQN